MEDLNKNQIVLLALLVSFVTSIATGIMTTALLQEAPVEITRNINRIVEKTVETVIPRDVFTPSAPTEKEVTTIIVKEEDSVIDSISKNEKAIVRIEEKDSLLGLTAFYGMGLVIEKDGTIVADRKSGLNQSNIYTATFQDGTKFILTPLGATLETNFILFKSIVPEKTSYVFVPANVSDSEPKLGQTVVSVGGSSSNVVSVGRIVTLNTKDSSLGTTTAKYLSGIDTDISSKDLVLGTPLFNLSGDFIGMRLSDDSSKIFVPVSILKKERSLLVGSSSNQ